ncbi:MAG: fused isobutyryl-CoA mutase/GTPase IcmF [Pseudomonadota bacterium]
MKSRNETEKPFSTSSLKPRFITAASLFDGHDAAINIMRRVLVSHGAEVIHLGHNRSADEIVKAAIQEDAGAIAISSYQGGHVEYFKYIRDLLKKYQADHIHIFGGGGGTITPQEAKELEAYGITKIYSPEDGRKLGLDGIIKHMLAQIKDHPLQNKHWDKLSSFSSDTQALSELLTCVELGEESFQALGLEKEKQVFSDILKQIENSPSPAQVVGMTGTGGAGKSSLTDELVLRVLESDPKARVAILAIDPTRRKTGGALLGDRLRMNSLQSPNCYMRSLATREANVSISRATQQSIEVLKAAGFNWIFVETGGIGQADTSISGLVDINIYVMTSEFGAPTQLEKIGMLDFAHLVVLNKFEKGGALDALIEVKKQFRRNHREFESVPLARYPIFGTIASRFNDSGVNQVFQHLNWIRKQENKRAPLQTDFVVPPPHQFSIVPKERSHYLAEISGTVRHYKKQAKEAVELVKKREALESLLQSEPALGPATRTELESRLASYQREIPEAANHVLDQYRKLSEGYRSDVFQYQVRQQNFSVPLTHTSLSQNAVRKISLPTFHSEAELTRFLLMENLPGYFPFTAGVFPFKRSEEDPKRQFAGEGTPSRTNKRFHLLCDGEKAKRLSTAFDSVTLYGEDPNERPDIFGKIGESGVSVCTLEDAKTLYSGFDLCDPSTSVSMTINGPAPMLLAFYFNTAIDQQVDKFREKTKRDPSPNEWETIKANTLKQIRGTVQADILKEDQAQNTCIFSTEFALRMMGDIQSYFIQNDIRNYYSVSISGYHIAEAGANPITQLAFTLANGFTYVEYYLARGMKIDDFAPNFSFFFSNGLDPEYTVIGRVARRIWAIAMRDRYGANERSQKLKYHIQTSGRSLHAQEISFNDIRTTLQALIAFFDNCNSLHTNAYDEALTTPTAESVRRAMAIQLIIAKELGWAKNENPLQGSFFIEELTDLVEEAVLAEFERISARGGVLGAMESHYQRSKIQEESLHYETQKHDGTLPIVGVNTFLSPQNIPFEESLPSELTRASYSEKQEQIDRVTKFQKAHQGQATEALVQVKLAASENKNIFEALMNATRVCSLGQISQALYEIGGRYRRNM